MWFVVLALLGAIQLVANPEVLWALSPTWAVRFVASNPMVAFLSLGAVVLVLSGVGCSWLVWRCPACGRYLGRNLSPKLCPHCGVPLAGR